MDWVLQFPRAKEIFDKWINLSDEPGTVFSKAGQLSLGKILCENNILNPNQEEVVFDFTQTPPVDFEDVYFNHVPVPHLDPGKIDEGRVEGLFAAMGAFTFGALAKGKAINLGEGKWKIYVSEICIYVRDRFNFFTTDPGLILSENLPILQGTLGFWSCEEKKFSKIPGFGYTALSNKDFRYFRYRFGRGGDFFVLSMPVCIEVKGKEGYEYTCTKK